MNKNVKKILSILVIGGALFGFVNLAGGDTLMLVDPPFVHM